MVCPRCGTQQRPLHLDKAALMSTKVVAVVLVVALVATGIGTGITVLLSR